MATKNVHFFATLVQNELNSDVVHFTTLQQIGLNVGGKTLNIANELVLHQCWKTSCTFFFFFIFFFFFYCSLRSAPLKNTHLFAVVLHDYGVKFSYTFYRGIVVCVSVGFFFYFCSVPLLWPLAFLIFSHLLKKKNTLYVVFIARSTSCPVSHVSKDINV